MADRIPVKAIYTGSDVTSLGEYISTDKIASTYLNTGTSSTDVAVGNHTHSAYEAADSAIVKTDETSTYTATQTFKGITETEATSSATTYTVNLANGTIFDLTSTSAVAITMPAEVAGKAFTIIVKTAPASWTSTPAILWASGTVPSATTISIYSFLCDGTTWYGMEAGNGFVAAP
jgi:hypothetical protein